ncbi:glycoside hydrolase family 73 protein [Hutsoniella sourekii]|uniref:glycoside hydrolase family 73 protein n=1 Tax=Hutsoniella sourekii TaxID=87650 RepID=UPI000484A960|nr:glycoside hydrolase family 73 protein [Hutsoniella sourekii]
MVKKKKSKKKNKWVKWWQKFKPRFLQRLGLVSLFLLIFIALLSFLVFKFWQYGQEAYQDRVELEAKQGFIEELAPTAQSLQRQYGVLASISLAQAALESDFGRSELASDYYNLYGVKTDADDPDKVAFNTMEFVDGEWIEITDYFKVYPSWQASMAQHAELIHYGTSWDPNYYQLVKDGKTYQEQASGLQEAGYATDPTYANKIVEMIEAWSLDQYDQPVK